MAHWVDNADSYVCSDCGYECNNPNKEKDGPGVCPRCKSEMDVEDERLSVRNELIRLVSPYFCGYLVYEMVDHMISNGVTILKEGEWIGKNSLSGVNIHTCSVCKKQISILGNSLRYCPNCGSKMNKIRKVRKKDTKRA